MAEVTDASKVSDTHEAVAQEMSLPTGQSDAISGFDSMVRYFHTMEERIKSLELQVAQLGGSAAKLDEKTGGTLGSEYRGTSTSTLPEILTLSQGGFEGPDQNGHPIPAIEMLIGDDGAVSKLRIRSEQLLQILQDVMDTKIISDPSQSLVMARPFKALMTFRGSIQGRRYETPHLRVLGRALDDELEPDFEAYSSLRNREDLPVSFPHLWYLFQPGDIVADSLEQSAQAYRVLSAAEVIAKNSQETTDASDVKNSFCITCFYFGYNGKIFGPVRKVFRIPHFHGKIPVTSLPITPIEYQRDYNMPNLLIERGERFTSLNTPRHRMHAGMTIDELPIKLDGEVIVDFELFYREHPDKVPDIDDLGHMLNDYDDEHSVVDHDAKVDKYLVEKFLEKNKAFFKTTSLDRNGVSRDLKDECLVLMPNLVWANHLKSRKWHALDINRTYDVLYPESPFEYLVIPPKHKEVLLSLASHSLSQTIRPDSDLTIEKGKEESNLFYL
ncbi:short-chain alcohol dehydrogenase [Hypoxylon texense]